MTPQSLLVAGLMVLAPAVLIAHALGDIGGTSHAGIAAQAPVFGVVAAAALLLVAWSARRGMWKIELIGGAAAGIALLLLAAATIAAYRLATVCPSSGRYCDSWPYPSLAGSSILAMLLVTVDLVGMALIVLNVLDDVASRMDRRRL